MPSCRYCFDLQGTLPKGGASGFKVHLVEGACRWQVGGSTFHSKNTRLWELHKGHVFKGLIPILRSKSSMEWTQSSEFCCFLLFMAKRLNFESSVKDLKNSDRCKKRPVVVHSLLDLFKKKFWALPYFRTTIFIYFTMHCIWPFFHCFGAVVAAAAGCPL